MWHELQQGNERKKFFREKLIDRYSEFVALAVADLDRARSVRAAMALGGKDTDYTEALKVEQKRHALRVDLIRVSLQIKLLEPDTSLSAKAEIIAEAQPFMVFPFPPNWTDDGYAKRAQAYDEEIAALDKQIRDLISAVWSKHSARPPAGKP